MQPMRTTLASAQAPYGEILGAARSGTAGLKQEQNLRAASVSRPAGFAYKRFSVIILVRK